MKRLFLLLFVLVATPAFGATKIRLHNTASTIAGYKCMDLALGPIGGANVNTVTTTTNSGTDIQLTNTAGGTALAWITEPLAAGFTLSGTVTLNLYGGESGSGINAKFRARLYKYSGGSEGAEIFLADMAAELNTTLTTARNWTGTPTSTAFSTGDRLVVKFFATNVGTMAAGTVTGHYEGATDAADGSSWCQVDENITFTPEGGSGGTPSIVQWVGTPEMSNTGQSVAASGSLKVYLPNVSLSGNCLMLFLRNGDSTTPTITDDQSNTWYLGGKGVPSGKAGWCFYAPNATAGTRAITVTCSATTVWFSAFAYEVANIATASALDGGSSSSTDSFSAGSAWTAGSFTPTTSGDMIFQYCFNALPYERVTGITVGTAGSPNITWKIGGLSLHDTHWITWGVYSSTSAINPSTTTAGTDAAHGNSIAIAFKSSAAGTLATGMRVVGIQTSTIETAEDTSFTMGIPTVGNTLAVGVWAGFEDLTGVPTDSQSATYHAAGALSSNGSVVSARWYYKEGATGSDTLTVSSTLTNTDSDCNIALIDIAGAGTFAGGSDYQTGHDYQTGTGTTTSLTLTPSSASGLAFGIHAVDFNTVNSVNSPWKLQSGFLSVNNTGNTPYYENNGFASWIVTSTDAQTLQWSYMTGLGANVANWAAAAVFFPAPSSGGANTGAFFQLFP